MTYNVYYITSTLEQIMASTDDADKAIQMAKREYDRLSKAEKAKDKIEIRYNEDEDGNYDILLF